MIGISQSLCAFALPGDRSIIRAMAPCDIHTVTIDETTAGQRLDRALSAALPLLSRSRLQALLASACISRDGATVSDAASKVRAGQVYTITVPEALDPLPQAQALPLTIIYEDDDLLVIDKAAGMTIHPAPGNPDRTLVNALIAHCGASLSGIGGVRRPGIVHRLDKDTSGLLVAAKNDLAHAGLSRQLADRSLSRTYLAVVWGRPNPKEGRIDKPIARSPRDRKKMAIVAAGRVAITDYALISAIGLHASLVRCKLQTGRTHQIRVHMAAVGAPLVGDPAYGRRLTPALRKASPALAAFPRQALHAAQIGFIHPRTGLRLQFSSDLPQDIATLIRQTGDSHE